MTSGFIGRCSIICRWRKWLVGRYPLASPKLGHLRGGGVKDYRRRQNFIVLLSTALMEGRAPILGANQRRLCGTAISISPAGLRHRWDPIRQEPAGGE